MNVLFVKSDQIGSRFIRWGLDEPVSHVAVEFRSPAVIYHAHTDRIQQTKPGDFAYTVVEKVVLPTNDLQEDLCETDFKNNTTYQRYDYPSLFYFSLCAVGKKFLGKPFPAINAWNVSDWNICTEVGYLVADTYARHCGKMILPEGKDLAITTPWQLCTLLKERLTVLNLVG